jgi:hypothetical protein
MATTYKDCGTTLPAWVQGATKPSGGVQSGTMDAPAWFGGEAPPKVGDTIRVTINNIGPAVVTGYFIEEGFLGVLNQPISPPDWYVKQNGGNVVGGAFGPEIAQMQGAK